MAKRYRVGAQSWGYDDWVTPAGGDTVFYPRATKRSEMLGLYSRVFDTIEVDATLYGIPADSTLQNWYDETSAGFIFSLKFPREITHDHALRGPSEKIMSEFVEKAAILRDKLGLFLVQFPASFEATNENFTALDRFLKRLPAGQRFAVEFRSADWFTDKTFEALQNAATALCLVEGKWVDREIMFRFADRVVTPFRYVRLMGERDIPKFDRIRRPRDEVLDRWSEVLASLTATDIFIYSDNYFEGFAPGTVNKVLSRLGMPRRDPGRLETQGSLF
jgi:uncharacterized protein YecE (DUF72 family)